MRLKLASEIQHMKQIKTILKEISLSPSTS